MVEFLQDLKYAQRALFKSPGFALVAIITLALGMAVNTTIFSVVNGMLLRPLPVPDPSEITVLGLQRQNLANNQFFSYPDYQDLSKGRRAFRDVFAYRMWLSNIAFNGHGDRTIVALVTGNYFSALGLKPAQGRLFLSGEGRVIGADPIVVLGYSYWRKRFGGDPSIVGKQVEIDDVPTTVVGVTPEDFHGTYSVLETEAYLPLTGPRGPDDGDVTKELSQRDARDLRVMARLAPGVTLKQAQASMDVTAQQLSEQYPDSDKGISIKVYPEKMARPDPDPDNSLPLAAMAFLILAGLVLLVACFNIANVLLVRATVRQREMAIRAALGAGRARLVRQYLTESLVLAVLGGCGGLLMGSWAGVYLGSLHLGSNLPLRFDFSPDRTVYLYALGAVLLSTIIVGVIPALRAARTDVGAVLHEGGRGSSDGPGRHYARNSLVVAQVAGSLLLLVVAGLFVRSLQRAKNTYLGFDPNQILNVTVDPSEANYKEPQGREYFRELETRLRALPSVVSVSQEFSLPMGYISSDDPITVEGHPAPAGQQPPLILYDMVSPGYFNTLRIPLLRGRGFSDADSEKAPPVAIINQTMAKNLWPNEDPLGKRFLRGHSEGSDPAAKWTEVVGIAQDGKYQNVTETPQAYFYLPFAQEYQSLRTISVRTAGAPENLAQAVTEAIRALDSNVPVTQVQTMHEALNGANGFFLFEFGAQLTATMGLLGLILASVGIYSVVSYAAAQRTQEIGIRMALGAEPRDILRMVLRQGLGVVGIGIAVGLLAAYLGARLVAGLLFNVSAADPLTYISVAAFLTGVALLACWIPARRATRVSPLTALRYE